MNHNLIDDLFKELLIIFLLGGISTTVILSASNLFVYVVKNLISINYLKYKNYVCFIKFKKIIINGAKWEMDGSNK